MTKLSTHCRRGHSFTPENTRWVNESGHRWRKCRKCQAYAARLRYRNNPEFREYRKAKALKRYYDMKGDIPT